jgi:hypothetical protein
MDLCVWHRGQDCTAKGRIPFAEQLAPSLSDDAALDSPRSQSRVIQRLLGFQLVPIWKAVDWWRVSNGRQEPAKLALGRRALNAFFGPEHPAGHPDRLMAAGKWIQTVNEDRR